MGSEDSWAAVAGPILVACLIAAVVFGALGAWISSQKHRSSSEGFFLGFFFGPFGCLIAALMPTKPDVAATAKAPVDTQVDPALLQAIQKQKEANERRRDEYQAEIAADKQRRKEAWDRLVAAGEGFMDWVYDEVICFGWFNRLPSVAQPIVLGLAFTIPAVAVVVWLAHR